VPGGSGKRQLADGSRVLSNTIGKLRFSSLAAATLRSGLSRILIGISWDSATLRSQPESAGRR